MNMLERSVIRRPMDRTSSVPFVLLAIHLLSKFHRLAPASATDWFIKGHSVCYLIYVIMHMKNPYCAIVSR